MGGSISVPLDDILSGCWDCGARHVNYVRKTKQNIENIKGKVEILKKRRSDVVRVIQVEEGKGKKRLNVVDGWLEEVEKLISEFESLSADILRGTPDHHHTCSGISVKKVIRAHKSGKAMEKLAGNLERLEGQMFDVVATQIPPLRVIERHSEPPIGAALTVSKVWNHIQNEQVGIVGLYGMGGVGKTTILTEINNKMVETEFGFDLVIWVTVSTTINLAEILNCIGSRIGREDEEWKSRSVEDRASDIFAFLNKKQFMLLLDGIWERIDLKMIGIPVPSLQNHSKVVFTCRSEDVCGLMGAQEKVRVECLSPEDAWDLFNKKVGKQTIDAHPDIHGLAMEVCQKCYGLPLMLNTLGLTLSSKRTPSEWRFILNRLIGNAITPLMEEMILSNLKLSYDSLENETIKSCFLYLCFVTRIPHIEMHSKEELVLQWFADGLLEELVDDADNYFHVLDCGYTVLCALQSAGLCDAGPFGHNAHRLYKMHDVIIEMGQWISHGCGNSYKRFLSNTNRMQSDEIYREANRMFLCGSDIKELMKPPSCPNLSTLVLSNNVHLETISDDFFNFMPKLRVLSLSGCRSLKTLPMGIYKLKSLRYLDIWGTSIEKLPERVQELIEIRILRLTFSMEQLPSEIFSSFKELRSIKIEGNDSVMEIRLLEELEKLSLLENLTVSSLTYSSDSYRFFVTSRKLLKCTSFLGVTGRESMIEELDISFFHSMESLESFSVTKFSKLKSVIIERREEEGSLNISCSSRCTAFSSVVFVHINECPALQDISFLLISLPNLERLKIVDCTSMKSLLSKETCDQCLDGNLRPFGRLKDLTLDRLPSFEYICSSNVLFPFLHSVWVLKCPALHKLPFTPSNAEKCSIIGAEQSWWDGLQWEDEESRVFLSDVFEPLPGKVR